MSIGARDVRLKRHVAVKVLPPELAFRADIRTRFLREAETAARLSHPNIVAIHAVDERDGLVYIVMSLVEGGSVGDRLRLGTPLAIADTRRVLREVADALGYAHRMGVVHRDIKPDNILLDAATGRAMVTDFGIARAASETGDGSRLTATGAVIGTPAYMSPEQCSGDRAIDGRSDLYSLGAVAYQMVAGQPPFAGGNTASIMMKQVMESPTPLRAHRPDVPVYLERIITRLLEKNPADRFAVGGEVVFELDQALDASAPSFGPPDGNVRGKPGMAFERPRPNALDAARGEIKQASGKGGKKKKKEKKSLGERVRDFRNNTFGYIGFGGFLFVINWMTHGPRGHWWFVYPAAFFLLEVITEMGGLISDGVPIKNLFAGPLPAGLPAGVDAPVFLAPTASGPTPSEEVLVGPYGDVLRQAATDRRRIDEAVVRLSDAERNALSDVKPTADGLYDRIAALASALHRLDTELGTERGDALDERIRQAEQQPQQGASPDRERRLTLLRRQRDMLIELHRSRGSLLEQYESAGLLLQNLSLDLLKARSTGLDSAKAGITSATQEARALSNEINYALDAAAELRGLRG